MDLKNLEKDWKQRGFTYGLWVDPPGQAWENYIHTVDELFMVVEGTIELEVSGVKTRPFPGEEILIPAQVLHSVRNLGTSTARWLYGYKYSKWTNDLKRLK